MVALWMVLVFWEWYAGSARAQPVGPPRCPSNALQHCIQGRYGHDEYKYTIDGWDLFIQYTDSGYFLLKCSGNLTLDNPALPRFDTQLRVDRARLTHCPPPHGSYAAALAALNVAVRDKLSLVATGRITRDMLAGLERLPALELESLDLGSDTLDALPPLELESKALEISPCTPDTLPALKVKSSELMPCALDALLSLRRLRLSGVRSPPGSALRLPLTLQVLHLVRTGVEMPAAALARLPHLINLKVRDSERVVMNMTGVQQKLVLEELALEAKAVRVSAELLPSLQSLTVQGWAERHPAPLSACNALDTLDMRDAIAEALPANWLQRCQSLRVLRLHCNARQLSTLDADVLRGSTALVELRVKSCGLTTLPAGLLDDAVKLRVLDFSGNLLFMLPSGLFASTKSLQELDLSRNRLTIDVFASLSAVTSLTMLRLDHNIDLKDSCGGVDYTQRGSSQKRTSPLQYLKKLTKLLLANTTAELICPDWRESMPLLNELDLTSNSITFITYDDMQFHGTEDVTVKLAGNNITNLLYTSEDYYSVLNATERSRATVKLDVRTALRCDCHDYWAAQALRDRPAHVTLHHASCAGGVPLSHAPLDELLCDTSCRGAPPGCACATRERLGAPALLLRLDCQHANLTRIPDVTRLPVTASEYEWHMRLAYNHIDELRTEDFPKHLTDLDLRNNSLTEIWTDAALALVEAPRRRVWLAHNALSCTCHAAEALDALRSRRDVLADYDEARCADGVRLALAAPAPCSPRAALLAGASAALALLAGAALAVALRRRAKRLLRALGWLPAPAPLAPPAPPDALRFDVFVSFSHGDERWVRARLVARLERLGYRLCVHYRDWAPGGWIPAQIAASVRASRRTLAVVSEHFLRSAWARAEFQEAHALALRDAEPRLVVVLLDAPDALPLDDKLRSYLATNTYVRWGDPWFWQKLCLALPKPSPAAPAEPQAPLVTEVPLVPVKPPVLMIPKVTVEPQVSEVPLVPAVSPVSVVPKVTVEPQVSELPLVPVVSPVSVVNKVTVEPQVQIRPQVLVMPQVSVGPQASVVQSVR